VESVIKEVIDKIISRYCETIRISARVEYRGLSLESVRAVADESGKTPREVEIAALRQGIIPLRYYRNIASLGLDGQARLLSSTAAVVGAGGLGGLIIELLARIGVGRLIPIDGDSFTEDNLNRQLLCREEDIGRKKIDRAVERVAAVNSAVEVIPRPVFLTPENAAELLSGAEVVIDGLDRIGVRLLLEKAAAGLAVPLVHGAVGGFMGQVAVVFPGEETLSSSIYRGEGGQASRGIEAVLGTPTITPAAVASLEAMEAVKILLGRGTPLRGELLYLDLESAEFSRIGLQGGGGDGD
jgi:molybdopterin-synthase adenylyltransferase